MSLLQSLLDDPINYYAASKSGQRGSTSGWGRLLTAALTLVMAFVTTVAVRTLIHSIDPAQRARAALVEQVSGEREQVEDLLTQVDELKGKLSVLTAANPAEVTVEDNSRQLAQLDELVGPGVNISVQETDTQDRRKRVQDSDLRILANSLWASGAEGIAINGHRLGPDTAVRAAGGSIMVNFHPIKAPYTVSAIGDQRALELALRNTEAGKYFNTLSSLYGISVRISRDPEVKLEKATPRAPKLANVVGEDKE